MNWDTLINYLFLVVLVIIIIINYFRKTMRITIVGGGNIGTQFAVHCAAKKHDVIIYTSQPELFNHHLYIINENNETTLEGRIKHATNIAEIAFKEIDLIVVTVPSMLMQNVANLIYDYTDSNPVICVIPGNGGSECAFKKCIERGNLFFGIERVPAIARLTKKGSTVQCIGYRNELHIASIPHKYVEKCSKIINNIFDIKCSLIPNYLNLTMTPSNPILHTTRLKVLFKTWSEGKVYSHLPLFYEEWNNESSELLFACDDEVQMICHALNKFDLRYVKSLKLHYESPTIESMTKKISSIKAFKGLPTPAIKVDGGFIPDLHSRYFTSDFSYGLNIIKQIGDFAAVNIPNINNILEWYKKIAIAKDEFNYKNYNINNYTDFEKFYML